jgi:hypothetical protein
MVTRILKTAVWAFSIVALGSFAYLVSRRFLHPVALDPMEGMLMDHAVRLAEGRAIYVEPSLEFVPLPVMPGFAVVTSVFARILGPALWEPRLISLLSILGIVVLVYRIVRLETGRRTYAVGAAGILLASYGIAGAHYDVGRPDGLMLLLALSGIAVLRFSSGLLGAWVAAGLMSLAFFTQQHAAGLIVGVLAHLAVADRRRLFPFALGIAALCGAGYWGLTRWLGPWFSFYTWEVPVHASAVDGARILRDLGPALFGTLGVLAVPAMLSLVLPTPLWRGRPGIWVWSAIAAVGSGLVATLDPDAFRPVLSPTQVLLSVLGPIALQRVVRHLSAWPGSGRLGRPAMVYLLLAAQFLPLTYSIQDRLPNPSAHEAHAELVRLMRDYPGPVLMIDHGDLVAGAEKGRSLQTAALDGILRARGNSLLRGDPRFFDRMFDSLRTGGNRPMIVSDLPLEISGVESRALWASLLPYYQLDRGLGWVGEALHPLHGSQAPSLVYVPKPAGSLSSDAEVAVAPSSVPTER